MTYRNVLLIFSFVLLLSCTSKKPGEKLCTTMFAMIEVTVQDSLNHPVILDRFEVRDKNASQLLPTHPDSTLAKEGRYLLLTDSELHYISTLGTLLQFEGFKGNQIIIQGEYVVTQDGCHINLVSGDRNLIVK
ncbi:MAG: hypothetical protein WCL00_15995 [Bacteroidota bacterium]